MFADKVEVEVKAGKGGDGLLSFRREKFRARGGPDGGDGGKGGDIIFAVDHNLNTLSPFRTKKLLKAENGQTGKTNRAHGRAGKNVVIKVPSGTVVMENDAPIIDLTAEGQATIIARGGKGGFGNAHFLTSTRQEPRAAEIGEHGEEKKLTLELKLVADVGLIGLPNAGKSTLLSVISNAKPEIADYPFTTLIPNLGVVDFEGDGFLAADIPGLIEGASKGKGLGDDFLRHIERTAVLLHLIDTNTDDIVRDYKTVLNELKNYKVDLTQKPQLVVLTKIDAIDQSQQEAAQKKLKKFLSSRQASNNNYGSSDSENSPIFSISASAHKGLDVLLRAVKAEVNKARQQRTEEVLETIPVIDETSQPDLWRVIKDGNAFIVKGQKIEGFARRTDWNNPASVERLRDIMSKTGVTKELEKQGVQTGNVVSIAGHELKW